MIEQFKRIKRIQISLDIVTELMSNVAVVHIRVHTTVQGMLLPSYLISTRFYLELSPLCFKNLSNTSASQIEEYFSFGTCR